MNIKSFVFLDSETTGLPSFEHNKTKITELCLIAVQADHIRSGVYPRVQNKITLCFNPLKRISFGAEEVTKLYNDDLANETSFNELSLSLLTKFLERLLKPICFVAHNGFRFDYPILRNHIEFIQDSDFPTDILCIDSLNAFREIHSKNLTVDAVEIIQSEITTHCTNVIENNTNKELLDDWDDLLCSELDKVENSFACTQVQETFLQQNKNEITPPVKIQCIIPGAPRREQNHGSSTSLASNGNDSGFLESKARRKLNFNTETASPKSTGKLSFKLSAIYERVTQKTAINAHHAEADTQMLLECAAHLGDVFVDYANRNAILFNEIPKMEPGKKIGIIG